MSRIAVLLVALAATVFAIACGQEDEAPAPTLVPSPVTAAVGVPTVTAAPTVKPTVLPPTPVVPTATPMTLTATPAVPTVTPPPVIPTVNPASPTPVATAAPTQVPTQVPTETPVPPTPTVEPEVLTEDLQRRLDNLSDQLESRRQEMHIPGMALAVVKDDEVIFTKGFGVADVENETPVTPETIFAIGSATKAFTATLIGMLMDDGSIDWDDPVTEHLPYFTLDIDSQNENAQVTIRDMLSHRTGFTRMGVLIASGTVPSEEVLLAATNAEPWAGFREGFHYSNVMYTASGLAASGAGGADWDSLIAQRIFDPLGMTSSNTSVAESQADSRLSLGYEWNDHFQTFEHQTMRDIGNIGPAGAINSNVLDMAQWVRFQLARGVIDETRLISELQHLETWTNQIKIGSGVFYGLGWMIRDWQGQRVIEHGGNVDGFASQVALLPESNLGFVLLTNVFATPLQQESINMVWNALLGDLDDGSGDIDYGPYLGRYVTEFGPLADREYTVLTRDGRLALDANGETTYDLAPPDAEGKWHFVISDDIAVSFDSDDEGEIFLLKIHQGGLDFEIPRMGVEILPEIDLDELDKYLGTYRSDTLGMDVKVVIQNNHLAADVPGQMVFELHPPDEDDKWIFRATAAIAVSFSESDVGVESMTMYQAGQEFAMPRLDVSTEPLPTVDEIMALRDTESQKAAWEALGAYAATGSIELVQSGIEGSFTLYVSGSDRMREDSDFGKFGSSRSTLNGNQAWSEGFGRFEELRGDRLEQAIQGHPATLLADWRDFYDSIRVLSDGELNGIKVYILKLQHGKLPPVTVYVDAENGNMLKSQGVLLARGGIGIPVESLFEDYREIEGVRIPFRTISSNESSGRTIVQYEFIETNIEVDESIFTLTPPEEE